MIPDEQPIRLNRIRQRMKELSDAREVTTAVSVLTTELEEEADIEAEEFDLRCDARQILHERIAYEMGRDGPEWKAAISILRREFKSERFGSYDEMDNSMLGLQSILEREGGRP